MDSSKFRLLTPLSNLSAHPQQLRSCVSCDYEFVKANAMTLSPTSHLLLLTCSNQAVEIQIVNNMVVDCRTGQPGPLCGRSQVTFAFAASQSTDDQRTSSF